MSNVTKSNLHECISIVNHLSKNSNYDTEKLSYSLLNQLKQLDFFYCKISKNNNVPRSKIKKRPRQGMIAYFNLGRGFPMELMDGHWCYILKDFGSKVMVIPCTSIKNKEATFFEMDIQNYNKNEERFSRLQFTDIRTIDILRIDKRKDFYYVSDENKLKIKRFINEKINN